MIYPRLSAWPIVSHDRLKRYATTDRPCRFHEPVRAATGFCASDGRFEPDPHGVTWLVFPQLRDVVFWNPASGQLLDWNGKSFALGEDVIEEATTFAIGYSLNIFADPVSWLRSGCDGIVVMDWSQAFDRLRYAPRVAVEASILQKYQKSMQPQRMPKVFVIPGARSAA